MSASSSQQSAQQQQRISIYEIPVDSDATAVMLLIQFLDMATKRGAFGLDETGKISECIQYLRRGGVQRRPAPQQAEEPEKKQPGAAAPEKPTLE